MKEAYDKFVTVLKRILNLFYEMATNVRVFLEHDY